MKLSRLRPAAAVVLAVLLAAPAFAQVLTTGNGALPSCAITCPLLNQAAAACGGTTAADQQIWSCFCQSGYLTSLYTSPNGICDASCTSAGDNQQIMTWYRSNCGTDDGAVEHANGGGVTTVVVTSTSTSSPAALTTSGVIALPSAAASAGTGGGSDLSTQSGAGWWAHHWKWIVMLVALLIGLLALALVIVWLKRRHDRRQDVISGGFNAGITTRSGAAPAPERVDTRQLDRPPALASGMVSSSGRASPARTREAFMPYGYAYSRSESRSATRESELDARRSPMVRGRMSLEQQERDPGMGS